MIQALEGEGAIGKNRDLMGATDPKKAEKGTIRADFADSIDANAVHGSDAADTAAGRDCLLFSRHERLQPLRQRQEQVVNMVETGRAPDSLAGLTSAGRAAATGGGAAAPVNLLEFDRNRLAELLRTTRREALSVRLSCSAGSIRSGATDFSGR